MGRLVAAVLVVLLAGCASSTDEPSGPSAQPAPSPTASATQRPTESPTTGPTEVMSQDPTPDPTPTPSRTARPPDPRWRFFTVDRRRHASPWFPGRHRVMIPFGCTEAPYYDPDPSCAGGHGFHHGIDVAIPCGTPLRAGRAATVLDRAALGPAYGATPVLLRVAGYDVVIGHTRRVFVAPGDAVATGEVFARVSDSGAPDGCHLHFEVRRPGGGVSAAVDPAPLLALRP